MLSTKESIRKEILGKLRSQAKEEALRKSESIKKRLFSTPEYKNSKVVMLYASMEHEVNTSDMIDEALEMGKRVVLPLVVGLGKIIAKEIENRTTDLEKSTYGIYEPRGSNKEVPPGGIDIFIVPGVAFDKKNVRLGRGKGYYDRFLEKVGRQKTTIGLAFDFQIVDQIPKSPTDVPVSKVITN